MLGLTSLEYELLCWASDATSAERELTSVEDRALGRLLNAGRMQILLCRCHVHPLTKITARGLEAKRIHEAILAAEGTR